VPWDDIDAILAESPGIMRPGVILPGESQSSIETAGLDRAWDDDGDPLSRSIKVQRPTRRRRRWFVPALIAGAATVLAVELLAVLVYPVTSDQPYSRSRIQSGLAKRRASAPDPEADLGTGNQAFLADQILHPYVGFAYDPRKNPEVNEFGFFGESPVAKRDPGRVNVAILGGSVARELHESAGATLIAELAKSPIYRGKEIHLICLAVDGFKQPQPLFSLAFAMYLGAEYDVVINFDGFNEVVLPLTDNIPNKVFPHYPRIWNFYADKGLSLTHVAQVALLMSLRERQHALSRTFSNSLLRSSNFMLIIWEGFDRRYEFEAQQAYLALIDMARRGNPDASYGPALDPSQGADAYVRDAVGRWAQASIQLRDLAAANGARYFHFLQPNQYVEDSKVFTEEEKRIADVDAYAGRELPYHPSMRNYKRAARLGYPLLIERGAELAERGVRFVDLTMIFAEMRETIYRDACCHYYLRGYEMIAERMAREIIRDD
jgi:hypothetical protein